MRADLVLQILYRETQGSLERGAEERCLLDSTPSSLGLVGWEYLKYDFLMPFTF